MELIWARAARLVRTGWRATVLLAILTGLTAGIAMAMVAAGRRTATAFDRFAAFADAPELLGNFCPPGLDPENEADLEVCFTYKAVAERDLIAGLPEVERAANGEFRGLTIAPTDDPGARVLASSLVMLDPGILSTAGRYRIVAGRDAQSSAEIVVNEELADAIGLNVGERAAVTFWGEDELGSFAPGTTFSGPELEVEVVGIGRALTDLSPAQVGFSPDESYLVYAGPGLANATPGAVGFTGMLIEARDDDAAAAQNAIEEALGDRPANLTPALGADEIEPTRDAIRYQAQAVIAVGVGLSIVIALFAAQLIARQARREWSDGPILRAIGLTSGEAGIAALVRGLAIAVPAIALACVTAVALSPLGPVDMGRAAELEPGVSVDGLVLVGGALALLITVAAASTVPLLRGRALRPVVVENGDATRSGSWSLPPVLRAAVHLTRRGRPGASVEKGTALAGLGAGVVVAVAACGLLASLDDLQQRPERFGAPWDLSIGRTTVGIDPEAEALADDSLVADIERAAGLRGTDMQIGDESGWVQAFAPVAAIDQVISPPIIEGRAPVGDDEIAVGALTLRALGLDVGDQVVLRSAAGGDHEVEIVGVAVINDTFEASPGRGAIIAPQLMAQLAPEVSVADPVVVQLKDGVDADDFAERVRAVYEGPVQGPVPQAALDNVERIRELPVLLAGVVAVLAIASFVHALVMAVNRDRRSLGVLKGLGFTRRQVAGAVVSLAVALSVAACFVALPVGIILGRWAWHLVADGLGVPAVAVVPAPRIVAVAASALVLGALAAVYPAWRAGRLSTATALRSE